MGTPAYMAPEVILGKADADRRVDVYALGCVAYFLLTGARVFEAENTMKLLVKHVQEEPIPPSQRSEFQIPRAIDDLALACLHKDPNRRPPNADALFDRVSDCKTADEWDPRAAKTWWETHLPKLTASVTATVPAGDARSRAHVVH